MTFVIRKVNDIVQTESEDIHYVNVGKKRLKELKHLLGTGDGKYTDTWTIVDEDTGRRYSIYARYQDFRVRALGKEDRGVTQKLLTFLEEN